MSHAWYMSENNSLKFGSPVEGIKDWIQVSGMAAGTFIYWATLYIFF